MCHDNMSRILHALAEKGGAWFHQDQRYAHILRTMLGGQLVILISLAQKRTNSIQ
jgi:hypothetical protein